MKLFKFFFSKKILNKNQAASKIQRAYRRHLRKPLKNIPLNNNKQPFKNTITNNNLNRIFYKTKHGESTYYYNPTTFKRLFKNGKFISPYTRSETPYTIRSFNRPLPNNNKKLLLNYGRPYINNNSRVNWNYWKNVVAPRNERYKNLSRIEKMILLKLKLLQFLSEKEFPGMEYSFLNNWSSRRANIPKTNMLKVLNHVSKTPLGLKKKKLLGKIKKMVIEKKVTYGNIANLYGY